jgi:glycosyltransferase involved in cell wall biosynthesis
VHTVHTFYWQTLGAGQGLAAPAVRSILQRITATSFPREHLADGAIGNVLRNLTLAMAARADVVVSPSAHQGADLAAAGLAVAIDTVPNPIARSPRPATLLTSTQVALPRVLWVARCEQEKRPLAFAEAAIEALERTNEGFEVDFVGSGSLLPQVRELVAGHPKFHVLGSLGHAAVMDLMDGAALVALTSHGFDNQPMTIAEAVSRYRGVLFCDPKLREGLGDSGWLSATPDAPALADSLVDLVSHPEKLLALSVGAQRDSEVFSAATYVARIGVVYERAAGLVAGRR